MYKLRGRYDARHGEIEDGARNEMKREAFHDLVQSFAGSLSDHPVITGALAQVQVLQVGREGDFGVIEFAAV